VLYDTPLPTRLGRELADAARGHEHARMRVNVRPVSGGVHADVEVTAPGGRRPVRLSPVTVPGGLGRHKWIDRGLLAAVAAGTEAEPLLCDLDGLVLEAARANVFVVEDGARIVTPPLDGRILPGVTRARVLELARELGLEVASEPLDLGRLSRADEIFVTGSLGGVEPAQLDGQLDGRAGGRAGGRVHDDGAGTHEDAVTAELARAWRSWAGLEARTRIVPADAERLPA
jgi:para-aminobenzoate synthetase/4-amino-4-deoxychorismate lyase